MRPARLPTHLRPSSSRAFTVATAEDLRWKRCNIKSTALLGNVMHYQQGQASGNSETILYNAAGEITEAAACNVFVVKGVARDVPMRDIYIGILPFWLAMMACLVVLVAFPQISLLLPNTMLN